MIICGPELCARSSFKQRLPFIQHIVEGLRQKNHQMAYMESWGAVVQAVVRYDKGLHAKSDHRKSGYASGY